MAPEGLICSRCGAGETSGGPRRRISEDDRHCHHCGAPRSAFIMGEVSEGRVSPWGVASKYVCPTCQTQYDRPPYYYCTSCGVELEYAPPSP